MLSCDSLDLERRAEVIVDLVSRFPPNRVVGSDAEAVAAHLLMFA